MSIRPVMSGVLLVALLSAGLLIYSDRERNIDRRTPDLSSYKKNDRKTNNSEPQFSRYQWTTGSMQSYQLSIATDVLLKLTGLQHITQQISGTLNMRVFDTDDEHVRVGFQLLPLNYTVNSQTDEGIQDALSVPFVVIFEDNGRPLTFQFPDSMEKAERIILEEAIRVFQMILSDDGHTSSWTVAEEHAAGNYLAYYQVRQDGSLQKQKTLYTEVRIPSLGSRTTGKPTVQLKKSASLFRISPEIPWLRTATLHEQLVVRAGSSRLTEMKMTAELKLIALSPDQDMALFREGGWEELLHPFSLKPLQHQRDAGKEEKLAGPSDASPEEHLSALVDQLNGDKSNRFSSLKGLEELMTNYPDVAFDLIEYIEQPHIKGGTAALLIHAMERAGTPEAQEALVMIMEDPSSFRHWNQIRAIVALGGVETATDEALTALLNISRNRVEGETLDLSNTALVAVGSIGSTFRDSDPDRAGWVREELSMSLQSGGDSTEAGMVLKAMGNMGDPALANEIIPYLNHNSSFVRASAAETLGRTGTEKNITLLTDQLIVEKSAMVRSAIVTGMVNIDNPSSKSLDMVNRMIMNEPDSDTRYRMVKYLGENVNMYPEGVNTLQRLLITDHSKQVRTYAATVLYKMRYQ